MKIVKSARIKMPINLDVKFNNQQIVKLDDIEETEKIKKSY